MTNLYPSLEELLAGLDDPNPPKMTYEEIAELESWPMTDEELAEYDAERNVLVMLPVSEDEFYRECDRSEDKNNAPK